MKDRSCATGYMLPAVEPNERVHAEAEEEDRWLKRTVSLPALSREPRPRMWQRAEGPEGSESRVGSAPCSDEAAFRLDFRTPARANSQAPTINWDRIDPDAEVLHFTSGGAALEQSSKGYPRMDKRRRSKVIDWNDLAARESEHVDKHRQLKVMLREQRLGDRSLSCSRHLVGHLARSKDGPCRKIIDRQKMEKSVNRIAGHITGCSHARHEMHELQKQMAALCAPPTDNYDLKHAFGDAFRRQVDHE